jgi:hypothetical protein
VSPALHLVAEAPTAPPAVRFSGPPLSGNTYTNAVRSAYAGDQARTAATLDEPAVQHVHHDPGVVVRLRVQASRLWTGWGLKVGCLPLYGRSWPLSPALEDRQQRSVCAEAATELHPVCLGRVGVGYHRGAAHYAWEGR